MELNLGGKLMKKVIRYLGMALLLVAVSSMLGSCIKDGFPAEEAVGTANVIVKLDSRAITDANVLNGEGLKTVRLIIVQNGKVEINELMNLTQPENEALLEQGITIWGLKKVDTDFYAIVNEKSTGVGFESGFSVESDFFENTLMQTVLTSSETTFPRVDIKENGLPMQGKASEKAENMTDWRIISIPVTRVVARIDLNIINATGSQLDITSVNFGQFFPSQTKLGDFAPGDYTAGKFNEDISIPSDAGYNTHKFTYYLYESTAGAGKYTVSLNDESEFKPVSVKNEDGEEISQLLRNTILSVNATAKSSGWELQCVVKPWEREEINVDFKDELSYVSKGWTNETIIEIMEDNVVHLDPTKDAELQFVIQTPNTATWRAQLVGDQESLNAIGFIGSNSGSVQTDVNGSVLPQVLKIGITDEYVDSDIEHRVELRVYAGIAGKEYELDLTNVSAGQQNTEGNQIVNRYTLLQKK